MSYTFSAKLKLLSKDEGGRAFFQTTQPGLIGGIPFHLNSWDSDKYITCFILAPENDSKFETPQEVIVSIMVDSNNETIDEIQAGSTFVLWEGRVTGEGTVLDRHK